MRKLLSFVLAAAVLAAGAYYSTLWYGAYSAMRDIKKRVSPSGDLHWARIRPGLAGTVYVRDLRLHWFDVTEPVTLGSVSLSSPGVLSLHYWLLGGDEPNNWVVDLNELRLRLQPDLFRPWARAKRALSLQQYPLYLARCGSQAALTPADLLRMGIDRLEADMELRYLGPGDEDHGYAINFDAGLLGSVSGQWRGSRLATPWLRSVEAQWPDINQTRLVMRDAGFMRRLASFCAAAEDEPVDKWAQQVAVDWRQSMTRQGMRPSDTTTDLYRQFLHEGGELELTWSPEADFRPWSKAMSATRWRQQAGLAITYNGRTVNRIGFAIDPGKPRDQGEQPRLVPVKAPETEPRFRESNTERAAAWIDRRVRLRLGSGRRVEGQLVAIEQDALHIRRTLEGGEVVAPFPLSDVEKFAVWRRPDDHGRPISGDEKGPGLEEFLKPGFGEIRPVPTRVGENGEGE